MKRWTLLYAFLQVMTKISVKIFYRKHETSGKKNLPWKEPIIFVPNHQNAFMDALVIADMSFRQTSFLVRADIFRKKSAAKILNMMKLMPVYRQRDGVDTLAKNEVIFNMCHTVLEKKNNLIIFPEGTHGHKRKLRPLKKGAARIALGAELKHDFKFGVKIVPVGLNYSSRYQFGRNLLINFGEPIDISAYKEQFSENEGKTFTDISNKAKEQLSELIIDIQNDEYYETIERLRSIYTPTLIAPKSSLKEKFDIDKKFIAAAEHYVEENEAEASKLKDNVAFFVKESKALNLRSWIFNHERFGLIGIASQLVLLTLFFPLFLYGFISNAIPFWIPFFFAHKKIKDPAFLTSIKMAFGMFLFPIFYFFLSTIFYFLVPLPWWWTLIYLASLPISGGIALYYFRKWKKLNAKIRYNGLVKSKNKHLIQLQKVRADIFVTCNKIFKTPQ